jgi:pimeloyl-ACP methyl ester carboxylesterase
MLAFEKESVANKSQTREQRTKPRQKPSAATDTELEIIDPAWLIRALGLSLAAAILLGYLAVCLLLWQGSWQLMLHPSAVVDRTPAAAAIPFQALRFDAAETGVPRLAAWWIPAARPDAPTILFLHDGRGSLSASVDQLALLHQANVNLFAFDYRGFGESDHQHPNEARMTEDTAAAFDYLVNTRHLPAANIVPYGSGLGAALAVALAQAHPEIPAVIVENPDPGAADRVLAAQQSRFLPVNLLLRDRFAVAPALYGLKTPRLIVIGGLSDAQPALDTSNEALARSLAGPHMTVVMPLTPTPQASAAKIRLDLVQEVGRFLDEYLPGTAIAKQPVARGQ